MKVYKYIAQPDPYKIQTCPKRGILHACKQNIHRKQPDFCQLHVSSQDAKRLYSKAGLDTLNASSTKLNVNGVIPKFSRFSIWDTMFFSMHGQLHHVAYGDGHSGQEFFFQRW